MVILTLNCGSSSVKYQVYDWANRKVMARGIVERVGTQEAVMEHQASGREPYRLNQPMPNHQAAIEALLGVIVDPRLGVISSIQEVKAVGHRVVHGGQKFASSVLINPQVLQTFRELQDLGPLHLPPNIMGIEAAQKVLPNVPHAAILDTAWHQTMPPTSYIYAVPYSWYTDYGVRRYGFHGTSFLYTAKRAAALLRKKALETNLIICHIGNGASVCAVKDGCSFDTSMGLTPLEGLVMGTRSGDIDPAIINFICRKAGLSSQEVENMLNRKSGILGITTRFIDRRDVVNAANEGDPLCQLAMDIEGYRIKKYIGAYTAALGRVDAVVFTAGVGEMSPEIRQRALSGLENLGIVVDQRRNEISRTRNAETRISADHSPIPIFVIPTDEELVMTEDTYALTQGTYRPHTEFSYSFESCDYVNLEREEALRKELLKKPQLAEVLIRYCEDTPGTSLPT